MSKKKRVAKKPATVMGRPTSYQPKCAKEAMLLCKLGATDPEMAEFFEVNVRTLNRWKITHPDFAEAIRKGKEPADDRVEDSLYHRALGTEYEEAKPVKLKKTTYDADGKKQMEEERVEVVMVKKVIPADTTAMIFWLKNRRNKAWRDVQQVEHGKPGDFSHLSNEDLDDTIRELQNSIEEAAKATQH